jgi:thioredoxin-like negative regulator of GroEL
MADDRIVTLINRRQFKTFLLDNDYFIVKACAEWCGPCKKCSPYFMKIFNEKIPEKIKLVLLDVDAGEDLAHYLRIKSMPTFIHYYKGEPKEIYDSSKKEDIDNFFIKILSYHS